MKIAALALICTVSLHGMHSCTIRDLKFDKRHPYIGATIIQEEDRVKREIERVLASGTIDAVIPPYSESALECALHIDTAYDLAIQLMQAGATITSDMFRHTAAYVAAQKLEVLEVMLDRTCREYANKDLQELYDYITDSQALHYAAYHGNLDAVRLLLQTGISIDQKDANGYPLLFWAVEPISDKDALERKKAVITELCVRKANPRVRIPVYGTVVRYAQHELKSNRDFDELNTMFGPFLVDAISIIENVRA